MIKKILGSIIVLTCLLFVGNVFADGFNPNDYLGIYYYDSSASGHTASSSAGTEDAILKSGAAFKALIQMGDTTISKSALDNWINHSSSTVINYGLQKMSEEQLKKYEAEGKLFTITEINEKVASSAHKVMYTLMVESTMTVTDDSGNVLGTVPRVRLTRYSSSASGETMFLARDSNVKLLSKDTINTINSSDFWGAASVWFNKAQDSGNTDAGVTDITKEFENMINIVGTTVIVMATIVLGIRYIIGTVDSKTSAKEGLITLFVACVFFFGWTSISRVLFPNNKLVFLNNSSDVVSGYEGAIGDLFATFVYFANVVVILAIIYVGVKYILAGAEGRSELKSRSPYLIIGIILAFATTSVLGLISDIITETIK